MKKTIALALALLLCFSVFAQGASEAKTDTPALKVGMVTDSSLALASSLPMQLLRYRQCMMT